MKKVIQFGVQINYVQQDDENPVILAVGSDGRVIGLVDEIDDIPSIFTSLLDSIKASHEVK